MEKEQKIRSHEGDIMAEIKTLHLTSIGESKVSQRGSVVLPKAVRHAENLNEGDYLEWFVGDGMIVVRKKVK